MAPTKVSDTEQNAIETSDNPYLSVIFRKHRSIKKKYESFFFFSDLLTARLTIAIEGSATVLRMQPSYFWDVLYAVSFKD